MSIKTLLYAFLCYNITLNGGHMITLLNKFDDNYVIGKINDICDIVSPYIRQYNLGGYLKDISFNPESKYLAYYNIRTNRLFFNDEKIIRTGYRLFDQLRRKYQISEKYYTYFLNYFYLYIIYHELTHVYQKARDESTLNELSKTAKLSKEMKFNFGLPVSTQELKNVNFTKKKILYQINKA